MLRKSLAALLVLAVTTTTSLAAPLDADKARERVQRFGAGSYVALQKSDGSQASGKITGVNQEGFDLLPLDGTPDQSVRYVEITKIRVVKVRSYKTSDEPEPLRVRQAVDGLGVGRHVKAVVPGAEYRGHIQSIGEESFVVLPDHTDTPVTLAYRDVREVRRNDSTAIVIVALVLGGVVGWLLATRK